MSNAATRTELDGNAAKFGHIFAIDAAQHILKVIRDEGMYRHLRCARPGTSLHWFEVVTWPGALVVRGDMNDAHCFARTTDMFDFFRRSATPDGPNFDYWAEKSGGGRWSVKEYSSDVARQMIAGGITDYETDQHQYLLERFEQRAIPRRPPAPADVRLLVNRYDEDGELDHERGARDLLSELESMGVTADTWEWDLSDWSPSFVRACHAVVWAIRQYDGRKGGEPS